MCELTVLVNKLSIETANYTVISRHLVQFRRNFQYIYGHIFFSSLPIFCVILVL